MYNYGKELSLCLGYTFTLTFPCGLYHSSRGLGKSETSPFPTALFLLFAPFSIALQGLQCTDYTKIELELIDCFYHEEI